jgi:signal transduction histidine kinase
MTLSAVPSDPHEIDDSAGTNTAVRGLLLRMARPEGRSEAAKALAQLVGAEELIVFARDPDDGRLLPAPGFVHPASDGNSWREFLFACSSASPHSGTPGNRPAVGIRAEDGTVLVLLGGAPKVGGGAEFASLLPFLGAVFEAERSKVTRAAEVQAREFEQQLIGVVSHDLRNPLGAVLMSASLLEKYVTEPHGQKVLKRIVSSAQRATRLVRDLLDFTQARLGGGISVTPAPMDLHDVVKQVVDEERLGSPERKIEILHQGSANGSWDEDRIAQVLSNLLSNALRYSPADTVVSVRTRGEEDRVVLEVHNEGTPIPHAQLRELFEPMKRGGDPGENQSRSIGLGLYIVRNLLSAHRATVSVQSEANTGTTFTVMLPR